MDGADVVVVDLTHSLGPSNPSFDDSSKPLFNSSVCATHEANCYFNRVLTFPEHFGTHVDAPSHFCKGGWNTDEIPVSNLVGPLVRLDCRHRVKEGNEEHAVDMQDVVEHEKKHGLISEKAIVFAWTGWGARWNDAERYRNKMKFPGFSLEAARFLVEQRRVACLAIDTLSLDVGSSADFPVHKFALSHGVYHIENVANLESVEARGYMAVVGVIKLEGGSGGPARILALKLHGKVNFEKKTTLFVDECSRE